MNKTSFCGISEHCGYQVKIDMEQHDKVIFEDGYNKAIDDVIKLVDDDLTSEIGMDMYVDRDLLCEKLEKLIS